MSSTPEVSSILKELKALSEDNTISIFLPSEGKNITFRRLNIKQQKNLVLVAMDDALSILNFNIALYDIIESNIVDPEVDILNRLNIFDKNAIIFNLIHDTATAKSKPTKAALNAIVNKYNSFATPFTKKNVKFNGGEIDLKVPSLYIENRFNKTLHTKYNKAVSDNKEFIADVYVIELCKYIDSITLKSGDKIKLVDYPLSNIIEIAETLPAINNIVNYITQVKDVESKLNTTAGETIDIGPSLFI